MQLVTLSSWKRRLAIALGTAVLVLLGLGWIVSANGVALAGVSAAQGDPDVKLFRGIDLFDGTDMRRDQDVLVSGARITAVGPTGTIDVPNGAGTVDGAGLTLLPGLVDSHVHLMSAGEKGALPPDAEQIGEALLFAGITTALVTAGGPPVTDLIEARRAGSALAPHLYAAGPGLTAPGGHPIPLLRAMLPWPLSSLMIGKIVTAASTAEANERVRQIVRDFDPEFVKIMYDDLPPGSPHMSEEVMRAAITQARALDRRPIVHATTIDDSVAAAEAGAALLVHIPQRGVLDDVATDRIVQTGVPVVTTVRLLSASHELAEHGPTELERAMIDARQIEAWREAPSWDLAGFSEEFDRRHAEVARDTETNFRKLLAAGVPLLIGTDSGVHGVFPGASLHQELRTVVRLGMSTIEALRAVTSRPAAFLEQQPTFGRVAPGMRADLLIVRGDPSVDITALADIDRVLIDGRTLERHPL